MVLKLWMYRQIPKSKHSQRVQSIIDMAAAAAASTALEPTTARRVAMTASYHDRELAAIIEISKALHTLTYVLYTVCTSRIEIHKHTKYTFSFYLIRRTIVARFLFRFHLFFIFSSSSASTSSTISPHIFHSTLFLILISFGNPFLPHFTTASFKHSILHCIS